MVQAMLFAVIALTLPGGAIAVFGFDAARGVTADSVSVVFFAALVLVLTTPWWPLRSRNRIAAFDRIQSTCFIWFGITFTTHLTWESFWLILHDRIVASPDQPWAYIWWMYIDGGDGRYATADPTLITQELLSVANGLVGLAGLVLWWRSRGRSPAAVLLLMTTAVVHLYSTALYFGSEAFDGYPSVDTTSFVDFWIKFWLLNGLWLIVPWIVLWWGYQTLFRRPRRIHQLPG